MRCCAHQVARAGDDAEGTGCDAPSRGGCFSIAPGLPPRLFFLAAVCRERSGQKILNDSAVDIGKPDVSSAKAVGKLLMINAQQVENRGMQIMDL